MQLSSATSSNKQVLRKRAACVAVFFLAVYTEPMNLAGCVLRNEKGNILLLHRNKKGRIQWELPGGKLEADEAAEVAATREIEEELGITVSIVSYLGHASFTENDRECIYSWYDAEPLDQNATPRICEPHTFDDLRYWDVAALEGRPDLSANLSNLLKSGVLAENT
jgi:8-oxo-dGTP diphosphatase